MALDRQSIEKRDFPIGRRGYEPEAVDTHLQRIADEVEALQRSAASPDAAGAAPAAPPSPASLAVAASEQVRQIVSAAENGAAEIEAAARAEADRIRGEADADAARTREDALAQSRDHVGKVREATQLMLQRVDAMEGELGSLVEALRTGANRLAADLSLLEGNLGELYDGPEASRPASPAAAAPPAPPAPASEPAPAPVAEPAAIEETPEPAPEPVAAAAAAPGSDGGDVEGARLVALNMALNGQSRDETDRYLAENFDLADRQALLDDVYDSLA